MRRAASSCARGTSALVRGGPVYTVADDPAHRGRGITVRKGNDTASTRTASCWTQRMALGRAHVGQQPRRVDGAAGRHVGGRDGGRAAAARRAAAADRGSVDDEDEHSPLLAVLLADEIAREDLGPGGGASTGLLDLVLVTVVRSWLAREEQVTRGLAHADPDRRRGAAADAPPPRATAGRSRPWLAEVGVSRSRRWRAGSASWSGEPPMTYLTHWRLSLAADLLVAHRRRDRPWSRGRSATAAGSR